MNLNSTGNSLSDIIYNKDSFTKTMYSKKAQRCKDQSRCNIWIPRCDLNEVCTRIDNETISQLALYTNSKDTKLNHWLDKPIITKLFKVNRNKSVLNNKVTSNDILPQFISGRKHPGLEETMYTHGNTVNMFNNIRNKRIVPVIPIFDNIKERIGFKGSSTKIVQCITRANSSVLAKMRGYINYRFGCNIRGNKGYKAHTYSFNRSSTLDNIKVRKPQCQASLLGQIQLSKYKQMTSTENY